MLQLMVDKVSGCRVLAGRGRHKPHQHENPSRMPVRCCQHRAQWKMNRDVQQHNKSKYHHDPRFPEP